MATGRRGPQLALICDRPARRGATRHRAPRDAGLGGVGLREDRPRRGRAVAVSGGDPQTTRRAVGRPGSVGPGEGPERDWARPGWRRRAGPGQVMQSEADRHRAGLDREASDSTRPDFSALARRSQSGPTLDSPRHARARTTTHRTTTHRTTPQLHRAATARHGTATTPHDTAPPPHGATRHPATATTRHRAATTTARHDAAPQLHHNHAAPHRATPHETNPHQPHQLTPTPTPPTHPSRTLTPAPAPRA